MKKDKSLPDAKKPPPAKPIKSVQFDLFGSFIANDTKDISNTIELWESIPKFFFTPLLMKKLRSSDGLANPFSWSYTNGRSQYKVQIQPALIEQEDGTFLAFFPSSSEELIEETLKKIFADQQNGIHDPVNMESWVRFSLSMLARELKERNRERNRDQIKHSINVMKKCIITVWCDGKEIFSGPLLSDVYDVSRSDFLADSDALWIARLPLPISLGINDLIYRQFNYGRLMQCDEQLSRWLYKRLVNRFIQAGVDTTYTINFTEIQQSSGLLQMTSAQGNRLKVLSCLDELKRVGVLHSYSFKEKKDGKKITETTYTLLASDDFIKEQKAANKRRSDNHMRALNYGITIPDTRLR